MQKYENKRQMEDAHVKQSYFIPEGFIKHSQMAQASQPEQGFFTEAKKKQKEPEVSSKA